MFFVIGWTIILALDFAAEPTTAVAIVSGALAAVLFRDWTWALGKGLGRIMSAP